VSNAQTDPLEGFSQFLPPETTGDPNQELDEIIGAMEVLAKVCKRGCSKCPLNDLYHGSEAPDDTAVCEVIFDGELDKWANNLQEWRDRSGK